jgi:hypothetical protein
MTKIPKFSFISKALATFFFPIQPKKEVAKKTGVGRRTFIKLEIPAKLPAKNSLS